MKRREFIKFIGGVASSSIGLRFCVRRAIKDTSLFIISITPDTRGVLLHGAAHTCAPRSASTPARSTTSRVHGTGSTARFI